MAIGFRVIYREKNTLDHNFICYLHNYVLADLPSIPPVSDLPTLYLARCKVHTGAILTMGIGALVVIMFNKVEYEDLD